MKKITINELTRKELLDLIVRRGFNFTISDHDIVTVRWKTMTCKAKDMMDEACIEMKIHQGPQNFSKYKKSMDKFNRAMKLYDTANRFIDRHSCQQDKPVS